MQCLHFGQTCKIEYEYIFSMSFNVYPLSIMTTSIVKVRNQLNAIESFVLVCQSRNYCEKMIFRQILVLLFNGKKPTGEPNYYVCSQATNHSSTSSQYSKRKPIRLVQWFQSGFVLGGHDSYQLSALVLVKDTTCMHYRTFRGVLSNTIPPWRKFHSCLTRIDS